MKIKVKASVVATVLLMVLFMFDSNIRSQDATPAPSPPASEPTVDKAKSDAQAEPNAAAAKPAQTPEPDLWHREELLGDWGGIRSKWRDKGFELGVSLTQFYQGVAEGGIRTGGVYNGTFQTGFKFDFRKLVGLKHWLAELKLETRFGGPLLGGTGTISPVNTAAIIPGADGTVFAVTTLNFTRLFPINMEEGNLIAFSFGRYNLVDLIDEDFFAGAGTERFFNIAQIGPLTVVREVPLITNSVSFAYIRGGEPFITFALIDPNDHSTDPGLSDLFADGVTFAPGIHFPTKYFGKTGKHSFGAAITTKKYTPFDAIRQITIPGPPVNPVEPERPSWSVSYTFRQYIVERARRDGWGFFTQVSFANKNTSPITKFFNVGFGGNGLFESRPRDEFGIAYAYTDLSEVLKDNLNLLPLGGRLRAEHQVEMFYNFHITPWLRLTGDLQIIRPTRPIADTAIIPGTRLKIIF
jgi:porin